VLPHVDSFLDEVVEVFREFRGEAGGAKDAEHFGAGDGANLRDTTAIP
jgi:hypothetical protein